MSLLKPYVDSGQLSFEQAAKLAMDPNGPFAGEFKFDRSMLDNDPGYQFAKEQGQNAVNQSNAGRGRLLSGAAVKDLAGYTTGLADQYYGQAFDRAMQAFQANRNAAGQRFGNLMNLAGVGYGAARDIGDTGITVATGIGGNKMNAAQLNGGFGMQGAQIINDATTGAANAKASGQVASGNMWNQAFQNAGNGIMDYLAQKQAKG